MKSIICHQCGHQEPISDASESDAASWTCPQCKEPFSFKANSAETRNANTEDLLENSIELERTALRTPGDTASELLSSIPPLREGEKIAHFTIQRLIDRGGFGYVFAAYDEKLERLVALKIPHAREMSDAEKTSFLREARLSAKLNHPNIVSVHEVGEIDERIWIASDLIEGNNLVGYMHRTNLSNEQIAKICAAIASGVEAAHQMRIIHRDLKPGNILIGRNDQLYVTDFGLAVRDEPSKDSQAHRLAGTLPYMSPEQLDRGGFVDARSDIYAIGVILYQLLAGERPYRGSRTEIYERIQEAKPRPPHVHNKHVPPELEAICLKAIAGNAADRYQSASDMEADLNRYLEGEQPLAYKPNLVRKTTRWVRMNKWQIATAASILALVAFFLFRPPTVKNFTLPVAFATNPPGPTTVAIIPIDADSFNPDPEKKIQLSGERGYFETRLEPGMYIIEAVLERGNRTYIQEVVRTVPTKAVDSIDFGQDARTFHVDSEQNLIWPGITISTKLALDKHYATLAGGEFETGSDVLKWYPLKKVTLPPFQLQTKEVDVQQYEQVMNSIPAGMKQRITDSEICPTFAVTNVNFYNALQYAEKIGARLPTLDEYLFAATNGGTSKLPWGDSPDLIQNWDIDLDQPPEFDQTIEPKGIQGLYSRVAEWTQTGSAGPLPPGLTLEASRMIAGSDSLSSPPRAEMYHTARLFTTARLNSDGQDSVGFRCARSVHPRFVELSK